MVAFPLAAWPGLAGSGLRGPGCGLPHHGVPRWGQSCRPRQFRYRDKAIMATIGYRSAVVQLPRRPRIHGTLAWLALHLVTLLGGRNRISALVNMSSRYLTWQHGGGLIVGDGMTGLTAQSAPRRPAGHQPHQHRSQAYLGPG